jgi:pyridoxine 5-phosphate synthase
VRNPLRVLHNWSKVTRFSVNLNKFALLRNARGGSQPDVLAMGRRCLAGGAHGLTVHPRPDERHTRPGDVRALGQLVRAFPGAELNVEGNPSTQYLDLVLEVRPHQATLVPDAPDQLTSDHGWDVVATRGRLAPVVETLKAAGVRVSLFLDPDPVQVAAAASVGADRIELYTERWARAWGTPAQAAVLAEFAEAARLAGGRGLGVNAGHDLNLANLGAFLASVPGVLEVSIGHAFVCESFDYTIEGTLARYLATAGVERPLSTSAMNRSSPSK